MHLFNGECKCKFIFVGTAAAQYQSTTGHLPGKVKGSLRIGIMEKKMETTV